MKKPKQFGIPKSSGSSTFKIPRLYDTPEWKEYSARFLIHNPKCYSCGEKSGATDHFISHKNNKELFWKVDNMVPLCSKCHNTVTANFDKFFPPKTEEKLKWLNDNRVKYGISFKVKVVPLKYERKNYTDTFLPKESEL